MTAPAPSHTLEGMRALPLFVAAMALWGCTSGSTPSDLPTPEPTPYRIDGTYNGDVQLIEILDPPTGTAVEYEWDNVELVFDQIDEAIEFSGIVGYATPDGVVFNSQVWRRYPGGGGASTNLQSATYYGAVSSTGGAISVYGEILEDGTMVGSWLLNYTFDDMVKVLP